MLETNRLFITLEKPGYFCKSIIQQFFPNKIRELEVEEKNLKSYAEKEAYWKQKYRELLALFIPNEHSTLYCQAQFSHQNTTFELAAEFSTNVIKVFLSNANGYRVCFSYRLSQVPLLPGIPLLKIYKSLPPFETDISSLQNGVPGIKPILQNKINNSKVTWKVIFVLLFLTSIAALAFPVLGPTLSLSLSFLLKEISYVAGLTLLPTSLNIYFWNIREPKDTMQIPIAKIEARPQSKLEEKKTALPNISANINRFLNEDLQNPSTASTQNTGKSQLCT